jgi:hypothetical protein
MDEPGATPATPEPATPEPATTGPGASRLLLPSFGRGWPWLLYIGLALPAVIWAVAFFTKSPTFALLFHNYGLYVVSPAPVGSDGTLYFLSLTGVPGLLIQVYAFVRALLRRDRLDAVLCAAFAAGLFLFFFFGLNYEIIRGLEFSANPTL